MDTQTQIERLIELAIVQRGELRKLVGELPQLREHLNAEIERVFEETEPQLRVELEEFVAKQAKERSDAISAELKAKIDSFAKTLNQSAEAKYSALVAERAKNDDLLKQAEQNIAFAAQALPAQVKEIVTAELARFPRAGEIDQLRKEFAEPKGLNPRGKWSPDATYNKLDLVGYNGDSFVSNIDGNRERPSRTSESWTLNAARGTGGGGGLLSINDALGNPTSDFTIVGAEGNNYVQKTLVAGANITITESPTAITIIGDEGQISLQDGTAAEPSLFFTNDTDTGLYRPAANTLGISVSGTQIAYFDQNGLTIPAAGVVAGGSIHAANGNANNPSHSFSGDQDTGFFRHQPNEIGIALGGTQYATLTSTTFSITPSVTVGGTFRASGGIVGTAVGASSPSTGAFTTLSASTSLTSPDLTLGTSGPSAKSSIAARAARQGLVGNGTAESTATLTSALGSTDKSLAVTVLVNEAGNGIFHFGTSNSTVARQLQVLLLSTRKLRVELLGATTGDIRQANTDSAIADNGKFAHVVCTISGSTLTIYVNGVSVSYTEVTAGTPPAWSDTVNGTAVEFGGASGASFASTALETPYVYNRALSAAEVVSLYEAGVPSGADYATPAATNTSLSVNAWTNSSLPYSTFSGASATGFTAAQASATTAYAYSDPAFTVKAGTTIRVKFTATLTSGQAPLVRIDEIGVAARSANYSVSAGSNTIDIVATSGGTVRVIFLTTVAASYAISSLTATPLGLLLAPDAAQAGGGLTWYDTSGNAANITLPASGVTWNVPTSSKSATGWSFGGNLLVGTTTDAGYTIVGRGTDASVAAMSADSTSQLRLNAQSGIAILETVTNTPLRIRTNSTEAMRVFTNGNVFIGASPVDGGQKLQVAGTGYISGNTRVGDATGTKLLEIAGSNSVSGAGAALALVAGSTYFGYIGRASYITSGSRNTNDVGYLADTGLGHYFYTNGGTLALTLDSSQNATFAGTVTNKGTILSVNTGLFSTDASLSSYSTTNGVYLNGHAAGWLRLSGSGGGGAQIQLNGGTGSGATLDFKTNNGTTALTLDSSQNATFAGSATIGTLSPGNNTAAHFLTGYAANQSWPARISAIYDASYVDTYVTLNGTLTGTRATPTFTGATTGGSYLRFNGANSEFVLGTYVGGAGAAAVPALTLKAGDATFAGNVTVSSGKALKLGNAYTAGAPTATGYVTIQDSAGNTYKVLVGT